MIDLTDDQFECTYLKSCKRNWVRHIYIYIYLLLFTRVFVFGIIELIVEACSCDHMNSSRFDWLVWVWSCLNRVLARLFVSFRLVFVRDEQRFKCGGVCLSHFCCIFRCCFAFIFPPFESILLISKCFCGFLCVFISCVSFSVFRVFLPVFVVFGV